jgi:protein-tyrosine-phosphatase
MSRSVLFVCTGNTCRSPLAEAIARQLAADRGLDVRMSSAGTSALGGSPASDGSVLVGLERGLDLSTHRARLLTAAQVAEATIILCMAPSHVAVAEALGGEGKAHLLTAFAEDAASGRSVHDPFGSGLDSYRQMAAELDAVMPKVIARLAGDSRGMTSGAP